MPTDRREPQTTLALKKLADELRAVNERLVVSSVRGQEASELAERERAQLRALLEALREGVVIVDDSGRLTMLNDAARQILGLGDESIEASLAHIVSVDLRRVDGSRIVAGDRPVMRVLRGETFADVETVVHRRAGGVRRLMTSGTSILEGDRVTLGIVVLHDVTERKQLEALVARTERLAAVGTLSAGMAHEINNPLTYIAANVDVALAALPDAQASLVAMGTPEAAAVAQTLAGLVAALYDAREGGHRVQRIVQDLKRFGRTDGLACTSLALSDVLESALRMTSNIVRHHALVRTRFGETPRVDADEGQLTQVFVNLLVNAAEATSEGHAEPQEIVVSLYTDAAGRAVAEVKDSGAGVPAELQSRVFDPFFTTKAIGRGMGLGLSISHSLVSSFGGELSTENAEAGGAMFRVTLPPGALRAAPERQDGPLVSSSRRGRVLVVDDEPSIGRAITRFLQKDHDVVAHTDGHEALRQIERGATFDIVLCDVMMPRMSGIDLYERLAATRPDVARTVVFITGGTFTSRAEEFLRVTTNLTLTKPLDFNEVRRVVANAVAGKVSPRGAG